MLCIHVLVVCIQVAILLETGLLYEYAETEKAKIKRRNPGAQLNRYVASVINDRINSCDDSGSFNGKIPLLPYLTPDQGATAATYLFLERGVFLASRLSKGREWDGWITLFYMFWITLVSEDTR